MVSNKPAKKTRQQQKEETRILVLKTARDLFLEQGYEKTTIRTIAQKAGIATGTAFTHFPDKKSLLAATLYSGLEEALTQAMSFPPGSDVLEILIHQFQSIFTHFGKTPGLSKILISETLFLSGEWEDRLDMVRKRYTEAIQQMFTSMKSDDKLHENTDCRVLAEGVIHLYFSVLLLGLKEGRSPTEQTRQLRMLVNCLLSGFLKKT
ncbi:MAG: TetR/AcrR family transcriptional regulator [Thermodesulfobacteriota bacterium]|nr:TetR/AcrR family transcriptional regulator [Thermodesulfobacteriota bacterium]